MFRQPALRFHEIVETSVIDQFHHHIKLAVVRSQREYLHDIRMIHTGSNARLEQGDPLLKRTKLFGEKLDDRAVAGMSLRHLCRRRLGS